MRNKIGVIESHLMSLQEQPNILFFTESWLKKRKLMFFNFPGYFVISNYCRSVSLGGGVIVLAKSGLECESCDELSHLAIEGQIEFSVVLVKIMSLIIVTVYRPPKGSLDVFLKACKNLLSLMFKWKDKKFIIVGDFNIDFSQKSLDAEKCSVLFESYGLVGKCSEATRQDRLIDNIFTNCNGLCKVIDNAISDHRSILFSLPIKKHVLLKNPDIFFIRRQFSEKTLITFKKYLSAVNWNDVMLCADSEIAFQRFYNTFNFFFNMSFPVMRTKITKKQSANKWWNNELKTLRDMLLKIEHLRYSSDSVQRNNYKNFRKHYLETIKNAKLQAKALYIQESKNKSKALWNIYRSETKENKLPENHNLLMNGVMTSKPCDIVNIFLKEFTPSVGSGCGKSKQSLCEMKNNNSLFLAPTNSEEVMTEIKNLGSSKCAGYDEITIQVLKSVASEVAEPLSHCVNLCFENGLYPNELKHAVVIPVHKKGDKSNPSNYRGIHLVSNIAKLFDKILNNRLQSFFNSENLLSAHQHGYQAGKSTTTALAQVLECIHKELAEGNLVATVFIDFSKAFDSCNHELLLEKLESAGVRGPSLKLFRSYLEGRTQSVHYNYFENRDGVLTRNLYKSDPRTVHCGVFAGTICGPILFNVYVNSLFKFLNGSNVTAYADDFTIIVSADDPSSLIKKTHDILAKLSSWSHLNALKLNTNKTKFMLFGSGLSESKFVLSLCNSVLEQVHSFKYLGVHIAENLDWSLHIDELSKQLNKIIFLFRTLRHSFSVEHLVSFYHAYFGSLIRMGLCFWGMCPKSKKILLLQKRCLRTMFFLKPKTSCRDYFLKHKIPTLFNLYILEVAKFVEKNIGELFHKHSDIHGHDTRRKKEIQVQNSARHNIHYIKIYNQLPASARSSKKEIKKLLSLKNYYSVNEFFQDNFNMCM